jgi:hypothetical protein
MIASDIAVPKSGSTTIKATRPVTTDRWEQRVANIVDPVHAAPEQGRNEEDHAQLGELRWLDAKPADAEPAASAVVGGAEQHGDERQCHEGETGPDECRGAVMTVVNPHHNAEKGDPQRRPHQLLGQEAIRLLVAFERHERGCAVHHDDAQPHQQDGRQEQHPIGLEFACHLGL